MKKVLLLASVVLSITMFSCGSSQEHKHEDAMPVTDTSNGISAMAHDSLNTQLAYICPCGGCPEVKESKAGKCPKCEMDLVEEKK